MAVSAAAAGVLIVVGCVGWAAACGAADALRSAAAFGPVQAAGLAWQHLSSRCGNLPVPGVSTQQTAALTADLARDGRNGFVLGFRQCGPALVWYRPAGGGWQRYVIEKDFLPIEAGGAVADIDGDGYPEPRLRRRLAEQLPVVVA